VNQETDHGQGSSDKKKSEQPGEVFVSLHSPYDTISE
jgi:hypothetical protein